MIARLEWISVLRMSASPESSGEIEINLAAMSEFLFTVSFKISLVICKTYQTKNTICTSVHEMKFD